MLHRFLLNDLSRWAHSPNRLPLLLQGARQTGKTWLMKELGRRAFKHTAYFDFAQTGALQSVFENTRDPKTILKGLSLLSDVPIVPQETLIIFDEIQLCDTAFGSLKYFAQNASEYAVAAAGSLLGVAVRRKNIFVPVGQVDIRHVTPLSFSEFLFNSSPKIYDYLDQLDTSAELPAFVMDPLVREYLRYQCVGGMPRAVLQVLEGTDMAGIEATLSGILEMYRADFSQYASTIESVRISKVWNSIPAQLAKENNRFYLSQVEKNARSREYEAAVQWLVDSGLVMQVHRVNSGNFPLTAYADSDIFKIYLSDMGLLRTMAHVPSEIILDKSDSFKEFKGAMAENYVALSLRQQQGFAPFYWSSGATAEVDFVVQVKDQVIPIEVKSGTSIAGKSLSVFRQKYKTSQSVRFSLRNLAKTESFINIPLPLADWMTKILN